MKVFVYKTYEIDQQNWTLIVNEFNNAFGTKKEEAALKKYYTNTRLGYSYHSLSFSEDGQLSGYNSLIPVQYKDNEGEAFFVGISGGTFVVNNFRKDIFIYQDMTTALWEYISKENIIATLGVSNNSSFKYALAFLNSTLISFLPYYALPVRLFNVFKIRKLSHINFTSLFLVRSLIFFNEVLSSFYNSRESKAKFSVNTDEQFFKNRFDSAFYKKLITGSFSAIYRIVIEDDVRTAYLFDFRENGERSFKSLVKCVKHILQNETVDLIVFIGNLRLRQFLLFRVPKKFEPQPLPLTFNLTSESFGSYFESMSKAGNWDFGLMNFDVR